MKLLADHNHNFDMAKFAILYPTVLLIPERKKKFDELVKQDPTFLGKVVQEAIMDLRGCKQDEVDASVNELRTALKGGLKPEELKLYEKKLQKMRVKLPEDIVKLLADAEEFSKTVRKKLNPNTQIDKRLTLSQLQELQSEARTYCLETAEISKLHAQVSNAKEWLARVEESHQEEMPLRELERLVKAGRGIPVNFGAEFERISNRVDDATKLQKKIQETFKSNKTRKTNTGAKDVQGPEQTTLQTGKKIKSNHGMYQEEMNLELQNEGKALRVTFKDLDDLNELIGRVQHWKDSVTKFLEAKTVSQQIRHKEKFKNYLNEAKLLKLNSEFQLLMQLQEQYEFIEWKGQVNALWKKVGLHKDMIQGEESDESEQSSLSDKNESSDSSKDKKQITPKANEKIEKETREIQGHSYMV